MPHMKMPRFQMAVKVTTGKGFSNFGKAATGKDFSNFGKGKDPFLSQNGRKESFERGKERKAFRPSLHRLQISSMTLILISV